MNTEQDQLGVLKTAKASLETAKRCFTIYKRFHELQHGKNDSINMEGFNKLIEQATDMITENEDYTRITMAFSSVPVN